MFWRAAKMIAIWSLAILLGLIFWVFLAIQVGWLIGQIAK